MESIPLIKVVFLLTKKDEFDFDREKISQLFQIKPSRSSPPVLSKGTVRCDDNHTSKDSIKGLTIIKEGKQPYSLIINAFWGKEITVKARSTEDAVGKLIEELFGKEKLIVDICNGYNLFASVIFRIYATDETLPEIALSKESIDYLCSLGACVDFDIQLQ